MPSKDIPHLAALDSTLSLVTEGYSFISNRRRQLKSDIFSCRLLLQPAVCIGGPDAVPFLFNSALFKRGGVVPRRIRRTLLGDGGVHGLDRDEHRRRKAVFLEALGPQRMQRFTLVFQRYWQEEADRWKGKKRVPFFETLLPILGRAACEFAGVPAAQVTPTIIDDLFLMVDAFGAIGPRHWRGRFARTRAEQWAALIINNARFDRRAAPSGSAVQLLAQYRDLGGAPLDERVAAVELLNVIRPNMAVGYFAELAAALLIQVPLYKDIISQPGMIESFIHELRRYCPFTPVLCARPCQDTSWNGYTVPRGVLTLLDVYGVHRDPRAWKDPENFRPGRFLELDAFKTALVQQGGGEHASGHRCAGEWMTIEALKVIVHGLRDLPWRNTSADLTFNLRRIPSRLRRPVRLEF